MLALLIPKRLPAFTRTITTRSIEQVLADYTPPPPLRPGETYTLTPQDRLAFYYSAGGSAHKGGGNKGGGNKGGGNKGGGSKGGSKGKGGGNKIASSSKGGSSKESNPFPNIPQFLPNCHRAISTWSKALVTQLDSIIQEENDFNSIIPGSLDTECKLEHYLAPGVDFKDFAALGAYMIKDMSQPLNRTLALTMISLKMKKLPEEGMKTYAFLFLNAANSFDEILFSVSDTGRDGGANQMVTTVYHPDGSYGIFSVPDVVVRLLSYSGAGPNYRVFQVNDVGIGNCEVKGDTTESYIGQTCGQLIVLGENMERSGCTQPDGSVITYAFRFSQQFFEVVQAKFPPGYFEKFRSGYLGIDTTSKAVFTRSKKYDILKADDRQEICRISVAVLKQLHNSLSTSE